ncbi:MAG TPA: hypothetical protein VH413_06370 [Verrucomicrobiae bacterium]|nr:hypothetical protein [Verrucomicrobiae bacterium]
MLRTRFYLICAIAWLCRTVGAMASPLAPCPLPLEKGMQWTYEGKVEWTEANSTVVLTTNVHWVMEVVDVMEQGEVRASVVRGMPEELAWYEPKQQPGFNVLLAISNRVYRILVNSEKEGESVGRTLTKDYSKMPPTAEEWLALPLAKGQHWGRDTERDDNKYCWYVEDGSVKNPKVEGFQADSRVTSWTLAYRTNPDYQIMEIVDGLGVTRYSYVHHGTVASADVRLVSFKRPNTTK